MNDPEVQKILLTTLPTAVVALLGLVVGLVSLWATLRSSRRTSFINTITAERVKWIGKVRENVSSLCALCERFHVHPAVDPELLEKISRVKCEVQLQLNGTEDEELDALLSQLPRAQSASDPDAWYKLRDQLIKATRQMLKREWDKVKDESVYGDLRRRWWQLRRRR